MDRHRPEPAWKRGSTVFPLCLVRIGGPAVRIIQELRPIRVLPPLPPQPVGLALISGGPDGALAFKPSFYSSC